MSQNVRDSLSHLVRTKWEPILAVLGISIYFLKHLSDSRYMRQRPYCHLEVTRSWSRHADLYLRNWSPSLMERPQPPRKECLPAWTVHPIRRHGGSTVVYSALGRLSLRPPIDVKCLTRTSNFGRTCLPSPLSSADTMPKSCDPARTPADYLYPRALGLSKTWYPR